ncbi:MAG TPA: PEP-CTERM sorting domain-containing protein, partial [Elainellaceae cyanobacterium]
PESVPEPGLVFGLGSMAVIGLLSRAKKSTQLA